MGEYLSSGDETGILSLALKTCDRGKTPRGKWEISRNSFIYFFIFYFLFASLYSLFFIFLLMLLLTQRTRIVSSLYRQGRCLSSTTGNLLTPYYSLSTIYTDYFIFFDSLASKNRNTSVGLIGLGQMVCKKKRTSSIHIVF